MSAKQVVLSSNRRHNESAPVKLSKYNRSALMNMSDNELFEAERHLKSTIYHARRNGENTKPHEIDLCHVQNEIYTRKKERGRGK